MPSLLALTLATTVLLAGCATGDEPGAAPAGPDTPAATSPGATGTPATSPSPSDPPPATAPTRTPRDHKTGALGPRARTQSVDAHLLAADRMPAVGDGPWTIASTAPEDPSAAEAVGACQKTALGTIGAMSSVRRTFTGPHGITATQVVAVFPDSRSAWRAHGVLAAWRDDCEQRLDFPRAVVGPLQQVRVHAGTGDSYRAAYGRKARGGMRAAGLGILRTGSYLTVVEITAGPGAYPDDWDPARVAVRRISRTF
jgi:hypothetical protein